MKHYLYLLAVLAGFILGGCTEDAIEKGGGTPNSDGSARLKMTFRNGVATRAIGDPFASEVEEKTINKLSFYVYPAKEADKELVPFQRYVFDTITLPLTKDSVSIAYANGTDATDGYTCDFILREGGGFECVVVAIANAPDNFDETNNLNTYAKLQAAYADCATMPYPPAADLTTSTRTDKYGLVMYAEDSRMIKKSLTTDVDFHMQRLAARIDISNAAYDEADAARGFVLQSARVVNGKHTSYVIPALAAPWTQPDLTMDFAAVTSASSPDKFKLYTSDGRTIAAGATTTETDAALAATAIEQRLWHELYTYENDDPDAATATTIEINGLFRGSPFSRILPFVDKDKKPVIIERNHRYLVRLNPAPGLTDITYNITVADWNAVDTINVKPTQKEKPTITYTSALTPNRNKKLTVFDPVTITMDAVCSFDTQYQLLPEIGAPAGTDISWISITASDPETVTRAETGIKRTYTVALADNKTGAPRRAMLLIANGTNFTARDTIHIEQELYYPGTTIKPVLVNNNKYWAPVNCGATAIPTSVPETGDITATCGNLYQWGRKYGFPANESLAEGPTATFPTITGNWPTQSDLPTLDDAGSTWKGKFILLGSTSPNNTQSNWLQFVKGQDNPTDAQMTDPTAWYQKLWNAGDETHPVKTVYDPCPAGWRVPTLTEWGAIGENGTWNNQLLTISGLVLPAAGSRSYTNGDSGDQGNQGLYWSSSVLSGRVEASGMYIRPIGLLSYRYPRAYGFSVRCVQE